MHAYPEVVGKAPPPRNLSLRPYSDTTQERLRDHRADPSGSQPVAGALLAKEEASKRGQDARPLCSLPGRSGEDVLEQVKPPS